MADITVPAANRADLPDACTDCGNRILLRRPGRTRCARCHPVTEWWAHVPAIDVQSSAPVGARTQEKTP